MQFYKRVVDVHPSCTRHVWYDVVGARPLCVLTILEIFQIAHYISRYKRINNTRVRAYGRSFSGTLLSRLRAYGKIALMGFFFLFFRLDDLWNFNAHFLTSVQFGSVGEQTRAIELSPSIFNYAKTYYHCTLLCHNAGRACAINKFAGVV